MSRTFAERLPEMLASVFVVFFIVLGIAPADRAVWIAEAVPVVFVFTILVFTARRYRFSNAAYLLMSFWLFWHTVGGHFTFAAVPFGFVSDIIGASRNHFDRIGHFSVGFYTYAFTEILVRRRLAGPVVSTLFGLFAIMSVAAGYEILEWWYAVSSDPEAGIAVLGSQGDIWDAQKDMLSDTLGALFSLALFWTAGRRWGSHDPVPSAR